MSVPDELNGFKFQYHVVLALFLDDPKSFVALGSEKQGEDCALKTISDKYWLAQCKYSSNRDVPNRKMMRDGLKDLKKHQYENVDRLILVTNITNPFCKNTTFSPNSTLHLKRFAELHKDEKAKLIEYAKSLPRKPFPGKFDVNDLQNTFYYAYCNYDHGTGIKTNTRYLVDKIREFVDDKPSLNGVSVSNAAKDWLRIVENNACNGTDSLLNEEQAITKGCLAGAFCNSALFCKRYSEVSREMNFEFLTTYIDELNQYCDDHREDFIAESIDTSYSVVADYYEYATSHGGINGTMISDYIRQLTIDSRTPQFIIESFENKGELRSEFQLAIYRYYAACVIRNCTLVQKVREEFGCDN